MGRLKGVRDRLRRARDRSPLARRWADDPRLWVEGFVLLNFAALAFDIYLAHSTNDFRRESEYIPLYCSAAAPVVLLGLIGLYALGRHLPEEDATPEGQAATS